NKIVDEFLTLPMIRLDGPSGHNRRAKCKMSQAMGYGNVYGVGYGFFGEWRDCCGRLEHRSLSGLVLSSPEICTDVFGTAQAITEAVYKDVINNGLDTDYILPKEFSKTSIYEKNFEDWEKVPLANTFGCTKSSGFMRTVMDKSSRIEIDISYIAKWLDAIRKLTTYSKYEKYIESLGALLLKNAVTLNKLDKNIKNTWGIV
ncbi:MAG: hypothetical protein PF437_03850, partial [Sulfurimonas sp.]|nr:hypothetical protein [Sulfurimonas sp.]